MPANMRSDVRHLHPVNIIVPSDHVVELVLPVHRHQQVPDIIVEKEYYITVNYFFRLRRLPLLDNGPEHICHILGYQYLPRSGISLRGFNDVTHIGSSL